MVMAQHYMKWDFSTLRGAADLLQTGNVAVLVFFFLSGFVIVEAADAIYGGKPGRFLLNRLLRIVPMFAAAVLVTFVVLFAASRFHPIVDESGAAPTSNPFEPANIYANLTSILPLPGRITVTPSFPVLRIAWALRVELAFYIVAWLLLEISARGLTSLRNAFLGTGAGLTALYLFAVLTHANWNPIIGFVPYFCAGGAYYLGLKGMRSSWPLFAVAIAASVAETYFRTGVVPDILYAALVCVALVLAGRTRATGGIDRVFGDLSYPVYVGHWMPLLLFASIVGSQRSLLLEIACVALGLIMPLIYFVCVERTMRSVRAAVRGVSIR